MCITILLKTEQREQLIVYVQCTMKLTCKVIKIEMEIGILRELEEVQVNIERSKVNSSMHKQKVFSYKEF